MESLYVYDSNPEEKSMKISMLVDDFYNKENILKNNGFITSDNKVTPAIINLLCFILSSS